MPLAEAPVAPSQQFDDPSLGDAEADAQAQAEPAKKRYPPSHAKLIARFEEENKLPGYEKDVLARMDEERKYVHTDANLATVDGGVSTNYLYQFQQLRKARLNARAPTVSVRPRKRLGQMVPVMAQMLKDYALTMEALVQHFLSPDEVNVRGILDGAIQDVDTVGIVYLKLEWLEDIGRDPVGSWRPMDFQGLVAKAKRLMADKKANKFDAESADQAELDEVVGSIKEQMQAEIWRKMVDPSGEDPRQMAWDGNENLPELSEIPKYRGFVLRSILPEDVRRDYDIFRPEEFPRSRHFTYRTFMTASAAREFYDVDAEGLGCGVSDESTNDGPAANGGDKEDPAGRSDLEASAKDGKVCVWVRMDRSAGKVYHWREGAKHFLRIDKPTVVTSNWFNVFPVMYNRVTGRFLPVSNTTLGKPLQDEINLVRTHKRQAKRAAYDRYAVDQDIFDDDVLDEIERCPPNGMFKTKKKVRDLAKGFFRMPGQYNPAVHEVLEERQELGAVLHQSQASQGMTKDGADSATEAAIANKSAGDVTEWTRGINEDLIRSVSVSMGEILSQAMPEENVKAIVGPGAFWPKLDREQLWRHVLVETEAGSTGAPDRDKSLGTLRESVEIGNAMGMGSDPMGPRWNPIAGMRKLAAINDWREDPEELVIMPPPLPMMPPGAALPGSPAAGGPPGMPGGGDPAAAGVEAASEAVTEPPRAPNAPPRLPLLDGPPAPPGG